ncbi:MAG: inositol monophosphatase family protein [Sphingobacteriaceae bacterium]
MELDLVALTQKVVKLTKEVGQFIREESLLFTPDKIEYKGLNDLVSYVDKVAEEQLVAGLSKFLPQAGFITEEKTKQISAETYHWIIDPLDGTTNFIHGIPTFSVSIALQRNQDLILGVVYEVNRDECFYAWEKGGAWLNGKPVQVSKAPKLANTLLATGFPYYDFKKKEPYLRVFQEVMEKCHGLRRIGSAAVDLAYVACGRFDGYFEYNLQTWDIAAGIVLVKEGGGEVLDFSGGAAMLQEREVLATNGIITQELIQIIDTHFNT